MSSHVFHVVDPKLNSYRLLYDFEHERLLKHIAETNGKLYSIYKENWVCSSLNAKVNDIICIKSRFTYIYRRVI